MNYFHRLNYNFAPLIDMSIVDVGVLTIADGVSTRMIAADQCHPTLLGIFHAAGLELTSMRCFIKGPHTVGAIHIDSPFTGESRCRLNWVNDTSPSYMGWYDVDDSSTPDAESFLEQDTAAYRSFRYRKLMHAEPLHGWFLTETAIGHKAVNKSNANRICISFFAQKNGRIPTMQEMVELMPYEANKYQNTITTAQP